MSEPIDEKDLRAFADVPNVATPWVDSDPVDVALAGAKALVERDKREQAIQSVAIATGTSEEHVRASVALIDEKSEQLSELRRRRERPYPRRFFRTASKPIYALGKPPRIEVDFPTMTKTGIIGDLLVRAWKRDLHEVLERESAKMRERREARERGR